MPRQVPRMLRASWLPPFDRSWYGSHTGVNIFDFLSCPQDKSAVRMNAVTSASCTAVEGLILPFSVAFRHTPAVRCPSMHEHRTPHVRTRGGYGRCADQRSDSFAPSFMRQRCQEARHVSDRSRADESPSLPLVTRAPALPPATECAA